MSTTFERGTAHPELAPSILSMVERERAERYRETYLMIQRGFTLKQALHFLFLRWLIEEGRDG